MSSTRKYERVKYNPKRSDNYFLEFPGKHDNINNCNKTNLLRSRMQSIYPGRCYLPMNWLRGRFLYRDT
jgi:hypothetical protein